MNYADISDWLRAEIEAGYTPDQAAVITLDDRIGSRHIREALGVLLLHHARDIGEAVRRRRALERAMEQRRLQAEADAQAYMELMRRGCSLCDRPPGHYGNDRQCWVTIGPNLCGSCREERARTKARDELREMNGARSEHGLAPLIRYKGKLMTVADRDAEKELKRRERELRERQREEREEERVRLRDGVEADFLKTAEELGVPIPEYEAGEIGAAILWGEKAPIEFGTLVLVLGAMYGGKGRAALENVAEHVARKKYGEKIWTGSEWVDIGGATRVALLASADWHDSQARSYAEEADSHRAKATQLRELASALPDDNTTVLELGPALLEGVT